MLPLPRVGAAWSWCRDRGRVSPELMGYLGDQFELALRRVLADEVRADGHRGEPALGGHGEPLAADIARGLVDASAELLDGLKLVALARHQPEHDHLVVGHLRQRPER